MRYCWYYCCVIRNRWDPPWPEGRPQLATIPSALRTVHLETKTQTSLHDYSNKKSLCSPQWPPHKHLNTETLEALAFAWITVHTHTHTRTHVNKCARLFSHKHSNMFSLFTQTFTPNQPAQSLVMVFSRQCTHAHTPMHTPPHPHSLTSVWVCFLSEAVSSGPSLASLLASSPRFLSRPKETLASSRLLLGVQLALLTCLEVFKPLKTICKCSPVEHKRF